jgi:hypothetical protein
LIQLWPNLGGTAPVLPVAFQQPSDGIELGQMERQPNDEVIAYSVQSLGRYCRWRVYGVAGRVLMHGVEASAAAAERAALSAFMREFRKPPRRARPQLSLSAHP